MLSFLILVVPALIGLAIYFTKRISELGEQNITRQILWRIKPGVTTSENFKMNMNKIGGNIILDAEETVITKFSLKENPYEKLTGWFHKNKLAIMRIDINGEHEKIYKAVAFQYGEADVNQRSSCWNIENQSEWYRNNLSIYLEKIEDYSSLVIVDHEINHQRSLAQ